MKLDYNKTFILGFGFFAISLVWQIYNFYIPLFLAEYFPNSMTTVNGIMTIDNILAVTIIPIIGGLSDRKHTKFGRRMPYLLIGMPLSALLFLLIPFFNHNSGGSIITFMGIIMIFLLSMSLYRSPTIALMPDITPSALRSKANGIINFMGGLGAILALTLGAVLYKMNEIYPFTLTSILVILSLIILFVFIEEPKVGSRSNHNAEKLNLKQSFYDLTHRSDKTALFILLAIFCWFIAYHGVVATFSNYCVKFLMIDESTASFYLSVMSGLFLLLAIPSGYLAAKYKKKHIISFGLIGMLICFVLIGFLRKDLVLLGLNFNISMIAIMIFAGISWALITINSYPLVVDLTTEDKIGTYTGLYYFSSQSAAIFGPLILGIVIDKIGFASMFPTAALFFGFALIAIQFSKPNESTIE